jgi:hypothetical protein
MSHPFSRHSHATFLQQQSILDRFDAKTKLFELKEATINFTDQKILSYSYVESLSLESSLIVG